MEADAAIAAGGNAERERDQFLGFLVERAIVRRRLRQRRKRLHGVGDVLAQFPKVAGNALGEFGIVLFHERLPYLLDDGCGEGCRSAM